jgi:hypothetical protein
VTRPVLTVPGGDGLDKAARERLPLTVTFPPEFTEALVAEVTARVITELKTPADPWPGWLDVPTAARYLSGTEERIYKLVARRAIPYSQEAPGCRIFFERQALDEWMRSQDVTRDCGDDALTPDTRIQRGRGA